MSDQLYRTLECRRLRSNRKPPHFLWQSIKSHGSHNHNFRNTRSNRWAMEDERWDRKPRFVQPLNLVSFNSAHGVAPQRTGAIIALHRVRMTLYTRRLSIVEVLYLFFLSCLSLRLPTESSSREAKHPVTTKRCEREREREKLGYNRLTRADLANFHSLGIPVPALDCGCIRQEVL